MKITIEAETTQESEAMKAPLVRTGVQQLVVTGRIGADALFFHSAGDLAEMIGGLTTTAEQLRMELHENSVVRGVVKFNNMMAEARKNAEIIAQAGDLRNGRELRIHRP